MADLLLEEEDMNNSDIKINKDFDIQGLNKEAVEIYHKVIKANGKHRKHQSRDGKAE